MSIDQIAQALNRTSAPIKRYIIENRLLEDNTIINDEEYLKNKLRLDSSKSVGMEAIQYRMYKKI